MKKSKNFDVSAWKTWLRDKSHYKKPIYILNEIEENHPFAEEIFGLNPIFLNGELERIKRELKDNEKF